MFKKALLIAGVASGIASGFAHANNGEWFSKIEAKIPYGSYYGYTSDRLLNQSCGLNFGPSDKIGIQFQMERTKITDIFNLDPIAYGSIEILHDDALIKPVETDKSVKFGVKENDSQIQKTITVKSMKNGKVKVSIRVVKNGADEVTSCVFDPRLPNYRTLLPWGSWE